MDFISVYTSLISKVYPLKILYVYSTWMDTQLWNVVRDSTVCMGLITQCKKEMHNWLKKGGILVKDEGAQNGSVAVLHKIHSVHKFTGWHLRGGTEWVGCSASQDTFSTWVHMVSQDLCSRIRCNLCKQLDKLTIDSCTVASGNAINQH